MSVAELAKKTLTALKGLAREHGVVGFSKYNSSTKGELAKLVYAAMNKNVFVVSEEDEEDKVGEVGEVEDKGNIKWEYMTVVQLKDYAKKNSIKFPSKSLKAQIIQAIIDATPGGKKPQPPPIIEVKNPIPDKILYDESDLNPSNDLMEMTVKDLRAYAKIKNIQLPGRALKADIVRIIAEKIGGIGGIGGVGGRKPVFEEEKKPPLQWEEKEEKRGITNCTYDKFVEKLPTTPWEDYQNFKPQIFRNKNMEQCLGAFESTRKKQVGKGSYGVVYEAMYKGHPTVFKIVKLPGATGMEGFLWECVISIRAAKLGIGPAVLETSICYDGKTPKFGVIVMGKCTSIFDDPDWSDKEFFQVKNLIDRAHSKGIIHRDVGYRNIMKSGNMYVLIDYGLAFEFPGPVPLDYRKYDYAMLVEDSKVTRDQIKRLLPDLYKSLPKKVREMEIKSAELMPIYMAKSLTPAHATMYLAQANADIAVIADRTLLKRIEQNK